MGIDHVEILLCLESGRNGDGVVVMEAGDLTSEQARTELYNIIRSQISLEEKAAKVLELGVRFLEVENGHLARIDLTIDRKEILFSTDPEDGQLPPGLEIDLMETYCRRAIGSDHPLALADAPEEGWSDDPAFESSGLHCYLGNRLVVDDEPYGTLCFVSEEPKEEFSRAQTTWAELASRMMEREIEKVQQEDRLTREKNLALVLNRVLRHNVRNDMAVIRGYTRMMVDKLEEDTEGDVALRHIDDLLRLTEKARSLDDIVASDLERSRVDVVELVENVAEEVAERYPSASVSVDADEEFAAPLYPSFQRAVEEILENAAKHSGASPEVHVSVAVKSNSFEIEIEDDGPGLSPQEVEGLEKGTETPLIHGSGLGLWIAHWVVSSHMGTMEAEVSDDGTRLTISIPRKPAYAALKENSTRMLRTPGVYEAAFEEASDGMVVIDEEARVLEANEAAEAVYGVDRYDMLGRRITEFLPEGYEFEEKWQEFQRDGSKRDTVTIVGGDGVEREVVYSATTDIVPGQHLIITRPP